MWWVRVLGTLVAVGAVLVGGLALQPTGTRSVPIEVPPPLGPPVLAVKVDNAPPARPPTGIGAADVVYVEPVEAGISRLVAVFGTRRPPVVGPVRSARQTDLRLLPQFGHPALAFSGAAPELLPEIDRAPVVGASPTAVPGAFYRGPGQAPHNLYVRPSRLPAGEGWSPNAALTFGSAPPGGVPTSGEVVGYQSARVGFTWSPGAQRWLVSMDGRPHVATDSGRLAASTVVLQEVPVSDSPFQDVVGNSSPFADTVGTGRAVVLRDGAAFEGRWHRPAPELGTTYTTLAGDEIPFAPGQVWIVLLPVR